MDNAVLSTANKERRDTSIVSITGRLETWTNKVEEEKESMVRFLFFRMVGIFS